MLYVRFCKCVCLSFVLFCCALTAYDATKTEQEIAAYQSKSGKDIWGVVVGTAVSPKLGVIIVYIPPRSYYNATTGQVEWTSAVTEHVRIVSVRPNSNYSNSVEYFNHGLNNILKVAEPVNMSGVLRPKVYLTFNEFVGFRDRYGNLLCTIQYKKFPVTYRTLSMSLSDRLILFQYGEQDTELIGSSE
jgi:hypothetical protein